MKLDTVAPAAAGSNAAPAASSHGAADSPRPVPALPSTQTVGLQHAPPGAEAAQQAARRINEFLKSSSSASVEFTVEGQSNRVVVRVVDSETGQLIRQMPSEEMLAISHALDRVTGLLLEQKA